MKPKYKISANLLLGIVVGLVVSIFIFGQGNLIISYLTNINYKFNYRWIKLVCTIAAGIAFILIIKLFLSIQKKRLTMYFILSAVVSMIISFIIPYLFLFIFSPLLTNENFLRFFNSDIGSLIALNVGYFIILIVILIFAGTFMGLVNRKVKYIKYISEEIKKIETYGFGRTMEVLGDDELSDLSKGINSMSIKLKEKIEKEKQIENNKNELITNVSHDLRTPLTSIIGYVSLIKQNGLKDKEKFDEYISVVERRLQGLNLLMNELFEYTKLSSNEFKLERFQVDIIAILSHLIKEYEIIYQKEGLTLENKIDLENCNVMLDTDKMIRVIQNLLDNARKYAVKGSKVIIHVYRKENDLSIEIKNKTDQLKSDDINKLFERFYKGDTARSKTDSSGLGLSIVKRIVELHEGTIKAKLQEDIICFEIKIPVF